jgi:hypothetical protein
MIVHDRTRLIGQLSPLFFFGNSRLLRILLLTRKALRVSDFALATFFLRLYLLFPIERGLRDQFKVIVFWLPAEGLANFAGGGY